MEQFFHGTYVINMDKNYQRLIDFDTMMKRLHWNYERVPAINGKEAIEQCKNLVESFIGPSYLSVGEIGCLLSHVTLWKRLWNNTSSSHRFAIFEDDARTYISKDLLVEFLQEFYSYIEGHKLKEPDILYLGKCLDKCTDYQRVYKNVYRTKHPLCLHAYVINGYGIKKLLDLLPYNQAIDTVIVNAIKNGIIDAMAFQPSIFFQDVFTCSSNIRSLKQSISSISDCINPYHYMTEDSWKVVTLTITSLVLVIILFTMWLFRSKNLLRFKEF